MNKQHTRAAIACLGLVLFFACSKPAAERQSTTTPTTRSAAPATKAQSSGNATAKALPDDCPPGQHPALTYDFDEFRFHRPKYDCESGFWFCTKGGSGWQIKCVDNLPFSYISGTTAHLWARQLDNGQMEMHFPLALRETEGYTAEDLATFNVDEEWEIYPGVTLKPGDYPVKEVEKELVVVVDTIEGI
jgi:hypothetical protein